MIVINGDITSLKIDIIVNAANKTLLGGGGVDGKIHRQAGPKLKEECKKLNGCQVGEAKITEAYKLPCSKIIHTVGPVYKGGNNKEADFLSLCYSNCMKLAEEYRKENKLEEVVIAFPCISTGVFGYPKREASLIAVKIIKEINNSKIKVVFCCYGDENYQLYIENVYGITIL